MSETVARQRPSVELDEFEQLLRRRQRPELVDDPLAEMARIVGDEPDPYADVFAAPGSEQPALRPSLAPQHGRQEPSFGSQRPRAFVDFAAIEAGLRGASAQGHVQHEPEPLYDHAPQPQVAPGHDEQQDYAEPDYAFPPEPEMEWADPVRAAAPRRSARKSAYVMAGTVAIALVGIGGAFAYKGVGSSPREIKTIMAAEGPTKIQPPADASAADQDAVAAQGQAAPTKLVSREEQPVDLQQAEQDNAARDAANHVTDAGSVPVPAAPPGTMSPDYSSLGGGQPAQADAGPQPDAAPTYSDQGFGVGMPLPKRVKSVNVKPDGTIVHGDRDTGMQAAAQPAVPAADDRIGALVDGGAPAAKPAHKAKATTRVATATPAPAADAIDDAPVPAKAQKKGKPVKVATAETGTEPAADSTADAAPEGSGTFAVQLAAPGSEADARSATSRFLKKFSGALHGRKLGFHRADSNGRTVYRVRVSSLSKEDAMSLCTKLKSDGGSCFVAKN